MTDRRTAPGAVRARGTQRMQLRYGFNEIDGWWTSASGQHRERIRHQHRLMGTQVVRVFVFDKPVPDPVKEWDLFAAYVQAVLDMGAVPMITFAKYHPPHDDPRNLRTYFGALRRGRMGLPGAVGRGEGAGLVLVRLERAQQLPRRRRPQLPAVPAHLRGGGPDGAPRCWSPTSAAGKRRIGGPAMCGFQTYWIDWVSGLVNDVDPSLVSFVSWHHYGDWRPAVPSASRRVRPQGRSRGAAGAGLPGPADGPDAPVRDARPGRGPPHRRARHP